MKLSDYQDRFANAIISRNAAGILTIRLHSDDGEFEFGQQSHTEYPDLFAAVASDPDTRVVIITGTGQHFIATEPKRARPLVEGQVPLSFWVRLIEEGNRLVSCLLDIPVPVIAAVNGPCDVHSEIPMLSDIVLCTPHTYFTDKAHFAVGLVPGDSMQIVWPMLLGPNRGRYFLLTGERLSADEAKQYGAVQEILEPDRLLPRAYELASAIASKNPAMVRNTRSLLTRPFKRAVLDDLHAGLLLEAIGSASGAEYYLDAKT
jgi:enoyl-CoA hydratase/carnithine racemase